MMFAICSYYRKVNSFIHIYFLYGRLSEVFYSNSYSVDFLGIFSKKYIFKGKEDVTSYLIIVTFDRQHTLLFKIKDL